MGYVLRLCFLHQLTAFLEADADFAYGPLNMDFEFEYIIIYSLGYTWTHYSLNKPY